MTTGAAIDRKLNPATAKEGTLSSASNDAATVLGGSESTVPSGDVPWCLHPIQEVGKSGRMQGGTKASFYSVPFGIVPSEF